MELLDDFELFLKDQFDATEFANELLLLTNSSTDPTLDLTTPSKRLGFDLVEIDKRVNRLVSSNAPTLYKDVTKLAAINSSTSGFQTSLTNLNLSFDKLDKEILGPYNDSIELHDALKKIHQTSNLLRIVQFFLYLVQNLQESLQDQDQSGKNLVKIVNNYNQLVSQIEKNSIHWKNLKLIRDYSQSITLHQRTIQDLILSNFNRLAELSDSNLNHLVQAFQQFDLKLFESKIISYINDQVSILSNHLIRTLTSPKNFTQAFETVLQNAQQITKLQYFISVNEVPIKQKNLVSIFYRDLAKNFEVNLKKVYLKGGPVSKNLKNYQDSFESCIRESLLRSDYQNLVKKDGLEMRMMLNSLSILNKK